MFRSAQGLGSLVSPLLGAAFFAWADFLATFISVGVGYILIAPFIYKRLYAAQEQYIAFEARKKK